MSEEDDFFAEIQDEFLQEAADLLGRVEALSLTLEREPDNDETFAELARLAHNFKGSGKAVGFSGISKLGHKIEDYILAIKGKKITSGSESIDFLFKCLDQLKKDVDDLIVSKSNQHEHLELMSEIEGRISAGEVSELSSTEVEIVDSSRGSENIAESVDSFDQSEEMPVTLGVETMEADLTENITESKTVEPRDLSGKTQPVEVLRIQKPRIDKLLESFGEQVILQSTLEQCKFDLESQRELLVKTISQLSKLTFELQSHALSLTMIQLGPTFTKLERAARDAARMCQKSVDVIVEGAETEVDKSLVDQMSDSLTHMVRNSVDHAIEGPEERRRVGKPEKGKVRIAARRVGSQLWLEIEDDGKGLDPEALKAKAIRSGILNEKNAKKMNTDECYALIFKNGFSTKEQVSEVSGRGVGMNVVAETIESLKGSIEIESEVGKGTLFRLKLPLSLAIFNGSVVRVGLSKFVVPNSEISEIARINRKDLTVVDRDQQVTKIRDEIFKVVDLNFEFKAPVKSDKAPKGKEDIKPVLLTRKYGNIAFLVDEIIGMQKIVQKPLGDEVKSRAEYAAGTILSDGSPGVIINLQTLCKKSA